jgi:hypothetical protein
MDMAKQVFAHSTQKIAIAAEKEITLWQSDDPHVFLPFPSSGIGQITNFVKFTQNLHLWGESL